MTVGDFSIFSLAGFTLNAEEQSVLNSSLTVKKSEEKFESVSLVAKILGIKSDYYVAQANREDVFDRKYFYCIDMLKWLELPEVAEAEIEASAHMLGRFTGDPAFEYRAEGITEPITLTEEKRLACAIKQISFDCQIVPRGSYYRDLQTKLSVNPSFKGLNANELPNLKNYFHFRPGYDVNQEDIVERGETFVESIDIFETLAKDAPQGSWSVQVERSGSVSIIKSFLWPGHVFFHAPEENKWANFYYGTGQKNKNLPFML